MGYYWETRYQQEMSLLMPFLPVGVQTYSCTLEEDVVVLCEYKNQLGWPEWHLS